MNPQIKVYQPCQWFRERFIGPGCDSRAATRDCGMECIGGGSGFLKKKGEGGEGLLGGGRGGGGFVLGFWFGFFWSPFFWGLGGGVFSISAVFPLVGSWVR